MRLGPHAMAAMLLMSSPSVAVADPPDALKAKYEGKQWVLQHNLHFSDGEASCVNFMGQGDYLPVGSGVFVKKVKASGMILAVGPDAKSKIGLDLSECRAQSAEIIRRLLGPESPSSEALNEVDLKGIKIAKVLVGMTRQGVFRAIGYPPWHYSPPFFGDKKSATNHDLGADDLIYMASAYDFLTIHFQANVVVAVED